MLGHGSFQFNRENVFSIISSTFSKTGTVAEILSVYMSNNSTFASIYKVMKDDTIKFLNVFGGTTLDFRNLNENQLKYTHIPEIKECFGEEILKKFYEEFEGQVVKVPPANSVRNMVRDVDIYIKLKNKKKEGGDPSLIKKLATYYGITPQEVYWSLKRVKKALNVE